MDPAYLDYLLVAAGGFAVAAFGFAVAWLRARERAIRAESQLAVVAAEARFDRLEQLAEANALEIERVAEAQHFQGRLLAGRAKEAAPQPPQAPGMPERVITPH
jgi:hypothetical protein